MKIKIWDKEMQTFCPGIGKGKIIQPSQIEKYINADRKNEDEMINEVLKS